MAKANDTDEFLVNRSDKTYTVQTQNIMADLRDDDLMLVNRSDKTYKITGAELKASIVPPGELAEINRVTLTEQKPNELPRFTNQKFDIDVVMDNQGNPVSSKTIEATVQGDLSTYARFSETPIAVNELLTKDYETGAYFGDATGTSQPMARGVEFFFTSDVNSHSQTQAISMGDNVIEEIILYLAEPITVEDSLVVINAAVGAHQPQNEGGAFRWYSRLSSDAPWVQGPAFYGSGTSAKSKYDWEGRLDLTDQLPANKQVTQIHFGQNRYPGAPTGGAYIYPGGLEIDGVILESNQPGDELTFSSEAWMEPLNLRDTLNQSSNSGFVYAIDTENKKVTVIRSADDWLVDIPTFGPFRTVSETNVTKYVKFNSSGAVEALLRFPQDPPYVTTEAAPSLTLTFPPAFANGLTPDAEFPAGTVLTASATATNETGVAGPKSASVIPDGTGEDLDNVFNITTYTGDGGTNADRTINTGIDMDQGALAWIRGRFNEAPNGLELVHRWHDTERDPAAPGNYIESNSNDAEGQSVDSVTDMFDGGFKLGPSQTLNANGNPYVAWSFRKAKRFFDIVTYTGNGQVNRKIGHALGSKPGMILIKSRAAAGDWIVYHKDGGNGKGSAAENFGILNKSQEFAPDGNSGAAYFNVWQNTEPTSTSFTIGSNDVVNKTNENYVAYIFASDAGGFGNGGTEQVIKCGSYTGNGGTQVIDMGFEPQFVIIKGSNAPQNWYMADSVRGWDKTLSPSTIGPENSSIPASAGNGVSNGFYLTSGLETSNAANYNYIYLAIAKSATTLTAPVTPTQAVAIQGHYPLYTTEADANAAGSGSSHTHSFDGVTYYMPDGGVAIYHGNYNEQADTTDSGSTDTTDSDDSGSTDSGSSSSGGSYGY